MKQARSGSLNKRSQKAWERAAKQFLSFILKTKRDAVLENDPYIKWPFERV